jgi:hypothetical protein
MSIIGTFNGASIVALPTSPGLRSVEFNMNDAVAIVTSPYTGQTQTQQWPGADSISGTITLPPLTQEQADNWIACLAELRGMANCFLIGDPMKTTPRGHVQGFPVVDMTTAGTNAVGATTLYTRGWTANQFRLLLPNDCLQIGYRLHRVLDVVDSDADGKAQISIWPSLRDLPTDAESIILNNPQGLFRLATNKRTWSSDYQLLTNLSFQIIEFR